MHIVKFVATAAEDNTALLGTEVVIKAQDGRTFSTGNNINDGGGAGELGGDGFHGDGQIAVSEWTNKRTTPRTTVQRLYAAAIETPGAGEQGLSLETLDGSPVTPDSPTRLVISLPFAGA